MNYRHAFHAGSFADCFKHALLVALVDALARKPAPFFVLDTHAGAGRYDLDTGPARRTGESDRGILRLLGHRSPILGRYLGLVESLGLYPGSPLLIRTLLRADDRLVCCELHPEEVRTLRAQFRRDPQVVVHQRSAWEALGALLPPGPAPTRAPLPTPRPTRGLVLIDPPFENDDEFSVLADGLVRGHRRFAHGVFAAWYPIKHLASVRGFLADVQSSAIRDVVTVELYLRAATDPNRLNGCGLLVINPPFGFEARGRLLVDAVLDGLGDNEPGARTDVVRIADE
jgi:23S rRNA (adenine2030-N6)-methyltransferase